MKKIILSLAIIGAVGAVVIGGTIAYFTDTESSTGNTFTAGNIDLIFTDVNGGSTHPVDGALFSPADLKPGDKDEKTVNLKVDNNPACGKVTINVTKDNDNSCTEPELLDEPGCTSGGTGELNDNVHFIIWKDNSATGSGVCNNILDQGETVLTEGTLTGDKVYNIGELPTSESGDCYGIAYCFGTWGNGYTTCDGSQLNNASQSDSFNVDLKIDALQKRNQFPNGCPVDGGQEVILDTLDIGNTTSESGHSLAGWSDPWVKPGWSGNYGGGSSDDSLRLLMGKGDGCTTQDVDATFTMNAGAGYATKLILEHLDGSQTDSFDVYANAVKIGSYTHIETGSEVWKTTTFNFPAATGVITVRLVATQEASSWCAEWGMVAFSNATIK